MIVGDQLVLLVVVERVRADYAIGAEITIAERETLAAHLVHAQSRTIVHAHAYFRQHGLLRLQSSSRSFQIKP